MTNLFNLLMELILKIGYLRDRFDQHVEIPPFPILEHQNRSHITLNKLHGQCLSVQILITFPGEPATTMLLKVHHNLRDFLETLLFELGNNADTEKDFTLANSKEMWIDFQDLNHHLTSLLSVHQILGNTVRR